MRGRDFIAEEKQIGRKYGTLMRNSFRAQVAVLKRDSGKSSKPSYRARYFDTMLTSLSVRTVNYVFPNFYGVDTERKEHFFRSKSGKMVARKAHPFKLNPKIKDLTIPEDIVNGLADDLSELRGTEVMTDLAQKLTANTNSNQ